MYVRILGSRAWNVGTAGASTTATALSTGYECNEVYVQADSANLVDVLFGNQSQQPVRIGAGKDLLVPVLNVNEIYVATTGSTAKVNWFARV